MSTSNAEPHVLPLRTYVIVFVVLLLLTATTTAVAYTDLGALNTPVALAIAFAKITIVALWFMHLKYSPKMVQLFAVASLAWFIIMVGFIMSDALTRGSIPGWS